MNDDITDPDFYLNTFEEGIKRLYASTSEPTAHSSTTSPLTATRASLSFTAPLQPGKLPSVKTEPAKTPDYFTHSANEGSDPTVFLPQKGPPSGHTFSRQVSSIPAPPATPVTPNRPLSIPTGRQRTSPVDKARIADYPTDAVEYGDEGRSASSRPRETPDYAATAANEGFVPLVDGAAPGTAVSRSEKERVRQHRQVLQERLGNEGYVAPLKLNPSLSSRDSSEDVAKAKNRTAAAREQLGNEGYAAPLELNSKLISPDAPAALARTTAWTRTRQDQLGNEGYVAPLELNPALSSPVFAEEKARTREWVRNAREQLGHEGGTLPDNLAERVAEFHRNVQKNATVIDRFLRENDRIERSAYGIPARGEDSQSVFKTYVAAKTESDNAENPDRKQTIDDLSHSKVGQASMDWYYSGAAGAYELASSGVILCDIDDPFNPLPGLASQINPFAFQKEKIYVDKKGLTYYKEPGAYFLYTFQEPFHEKARHFRAARSDDFKNASIENPGYLPVKLIGEEIIEDWSSTLGTTGIGKLFYKGGKLFLKEGKLVRNVGKFLGVATAIQIDYARQYRTLMDKWMNKPEEEMWKDEAYREMRRQNIPDHEARFYVARAHARKESGKWVLFSLLKKGMAHYLLKSTRTGEEGGPVKYAQDKFLNKTIDSVADEGIDWIKGKARGDNQEEEK